MRRLLVSCLFLALVAVPALADIRAITETMTGGDNASEEMNMTVESFTDGEKGNFYIRKSSNPFMKEGMYLYTPDGGKTLFLVDPVEMTYSEWDLEAIIQFAGTVLQSLGPLVKFEIVDPKVELLTEQAGPSWDGLATTEYTFRSEYTMKTRVMGIKSQQHVNARTKIRTAQLPTPLGVWMRTDPPKTGTEFDKIVENSPWGEIAGQVALDYRADTVITSGKKNNQQSSWMESKTIELDRDAGGPPGGYGFPDTYQPVQMMPTQEQLAGQESKDGKKKGRFGGLFKKGDGS